MASAAKLKVGRDDSCAADGSQLLALGDIEFTANADGIEGASFIAGGTISGTSNMIMGFCNHAGMERNFEAEYFRLAI